MKMLFAVDGYGDWLQGNLGERILRVLKHPRALSVLVSTVMIDNDPVDFPEYEEWQKVRFTGYTYHREDNEGKDTDRPVLLGKMTFGMVDKETNHPIEFDVGFNENGMLMYVREGSYPGICEVAAPDIANPLNNKFVRIYKILEICWDENKDKDVVEQHEVKTIVADRDILGSCVHYLSPAIGYSYIDRSIQYDLKYRNGKISTLKEYWDVYNEWCDLILSEDDCPYLGKIINAIQLANKPFNSINKEWNKCTKQLLTEWMTLPGLDDQDNVKHYFNKGITLTNLKRILEHVKTSPAEPRCVNEDKEDKPSKHGDLLYTVKKWLAGIFN